MALDRGPPPRPPIGAPPGGPDSDPQDGVVRVVVCEDRSVLRRRLVLALEDDPGIDIVAEATDGEHALVACVEHAPDCVVVGLHVAPEGGPAIAASLRRVAPPQAIVMMASSRDEMKAVQALAWGASGILSEHAPDQGPAVVRATTWGVVALPPLVARLLVDTFVQDGPDVVLQGWMSGADGSVGAGDEPADGRPLSDQGPRVVVSWRERAVLEQLAAGRTYSDAAETLGLEAGGARNLVANLLLRWQRALAVAAGGRRVTRPGAAGEAADSGR